MCSPIYPSRKRCPTIKMFQDRQKKTARNQKGFRARTPLSGLTHREILVRNSGLAHFFSCQIASTFVNYHPYGLSDRVNSTLQPGQTASLANRTVDVCKIDCEGCEFSFPMFHGLHGEGADDPHFWPRMILIEIHQGTGGRFPTVEVMIQKLSNLRGILCPLLPQGAEHHWL